MKTNGNDKVMFGTNYPMITPDNALSDLPMIGLSPETEALFLGANTARVFDIR